MSNANLEGWADSELEILRSELNCLYQVSKVLSHSLNFKQTLNGVLTVLHDGMSLERGMVSLIDSESGELQISLVYGVSDTVTEDISYLPGEGIVGAILKSGNSIVVDRIMDEPRFLSRLGIYNPRGAFVGVPIRIGQKIVGVLAAQPTMRASNALNEYRRFLEMVANLIGQSVRLSQEVAQEKLEIVEERDGLRRAVRGQFGFDNIIGHTQVMKRIFEQVRLVAKWNTTVLIRGETGTGKELIANAIHYNSPRARGNYVKLNCAALPETLLESELFGHEKGAFTGAVAQRKGRFEQLKVALSFSMRSVKFLPLFKLSYFACYKKANWKESVVRAPLKLTCAWLPLPIAT
jgi:Nif-specific regulatory protein